ncbi:hypothetical protein E2C01_076949 [Portunus trituberculatus]|uniref:Secreted protein n=1 Tax=Portunus trituberculatus TaxID=210409 RepID=A0A5B7IA36_PORTR|nr:hypothetical protein [Portunus trituberculatus]
MLAGLSHALFAALLQEIASHSLPRTCCPANLGTCVALVEDQREDLVRSERTGMWLMLFLTSYEVGCEAKETVVWRL